MERLMVIVADPVKAMLITIWGYVPAIIGAILILIIGYFIAKLIETVVVKVLKAVRLDTASDKAGLTNILAQGDIKGTLSEMIGSVVYWLVIFVVAVTALNALKLTVAADILSKFAGYIPNILGAIFVLVLGTFLSNFVAMVVKTSASNAGIENPKFLAETARIILMIFAVVMALDQLGIGAFLGNVIQILLLSVGIAVGIAFGLGCKDLAGKAISDMVGRMKK